MHVENREKTEGKNHWGICIMPNGALVKLKARLVVEYCFHNHSMIHSAKSHESKHSVFLSLFHKNKLKHKHTSSSKTQRDRQEAQLSSMLAKACRNSQFCQVSVKGKESAKGRVGVGRMEGWDPHTWKKGRKGTTGWFIQRVRRGWIKL